jgi:hypothetical protein
VSKLGICSTFPQSIIPLTHTPAVSSLLPAPPPPASQADRAWRQMTVQHELSGLNLDPEEHAHAIEQHKASETAHLRATRQRMCLGALIIRRGLFFPAPPTIFSLICSK